MTDEKETIKVVWNATCEKIQKDEREKMLEIFMPILEELIASKKATARCHPDGEIRGNAQQRVYDLEDLKAVLTK